MTIDIPEMNAQWQPHDASAVAHNVINGRKVATDNRQTVVNPADWSETVGEVHMANVELVDQAVSAAARAFPGWAGTAVSSRIQTVAAAIAAISGVAPPEAFARLITREQGKPLFESSYEASRHTGLLKVFADLAEQTLVFDELVDDKGRRRVGHVPVGPVAVVTPWNWPVALSLAKVLPALLAGNPVVLKPAPNTPLAISLMIEAMASQLPPGVLNIVHGGGDIGAALIGHPGVRKVVFVGSTASGRKVYAASADTIKRLTLELGGNDPAILLDDFEPNERNIGLLLRSVFVTTGQVCWAIKRVYVPARRHDEICAALVEATNKLVIGNGLDRSVTMGPLNNRMQYDRVGTLIEEARALGGQLVECGTIAAGTQWDQGFFRRPMIATHLPDSAGLVADEQFGPVLPVLSYDSLDEAIARANATDFGLCASVWGSNEDRAFDVATRLQAGQVFVNCHAGAAIDYDSPFGGVKQSGLGHEHGADALYDYMDTRLYSSRLLFDF